MAVIAAGVCECKERCGQCHCVIPPLIKDDRFAVSGVRLYLPALFTEKPPPSPRPLHPAASLFISSSQVRSRSFLTTVALPQFGLLIHHRSVNKQDDLDSHCRR